MKENVSNGIDHDLFKYNTTKGINSNDKLKMGDLNNMM